MRKKLSLNHFKNFLAVLMIIVLIKLTFIFYWIQNISQHQTKLKLTTTKKLPQVSWHNFSYIHNPGPKICGKNYGNEILIIAFVCSSPVNLKKRNLIRQTWAKKSLFEKYLRVVFLLGDSQNKTINKEIQNEFELYSDIVQENFKDSYANLTLKTLMGFKWVSKFCSNAKYALKIDDDVVVDTSNLIKFFENFYRKKFQSNIIFGNYNKRPWPRRSNKSKFYVSYEDFNQTYYDPYCNGLAYLITTDLASTLYSISAYRKPFIFEDVYVGMLAKMIKAKFYPINFKIMFNRKAVHNFASKNYLNFFKKYFLVLTESDFVFQRISKFYLLNNKIN